MSLESDPTLAQVYVELLDEGTYCLRPTLGRQIGRMTYLLLPTENDDPGDEHWQFLPGTVVACEWVAHRGERLLVAKRIADGIE
jgi:hypothetical protein